MSRITLTLSQALNAALRARALAEGNRTRSSVARAALVAYLDARKKIPDSKIQDPRPEAAE